MNGPSGAGASPGEGPRLVPILLLGPQARVMLPAEDGPVEARSPAGERPDVFDLTDYLAARYGRLYVVDLDGIDHGRPQLDYLQEISRDTDVWVDGGVDRADSMIDILVAGARRAVVSPARLAGPKELRRALALSPEVVVEIEVRSRRPMVRSGTWPADLDGLVQSIREIGVSEIVYSPREGPIDWSDVGRVATNAQVWVDGSFERAEVERLRSVRASGGLFHLHDELGEFFARSGR
jgi:phosphoribosylformimino-5-aminoimidazole carboxamide ribonucleotide (ProFAR) isomerase